MLEVWQGSRDRYVYTTLETLLTLGWGEKGKEREWKGERDREEEEGERSKVKERGGRKRGRKRGRKKGRERGRKKGRERGREKEIWERYRTTVRRNHKSC